MQLVRIEVPVAHYLERRSFCWHAIHVLCRAQTLVILGVLLQRKDKLALIFIINGFYIYNFFCLSVEMVGFEPGIL
jgi:hypothetical protein